MTTRIAGWRAGTIALVCSIGLATAEAAGLDGITIIELKDADAAHVIHGSRTGHDPYLAVYVSAAGSYASVGNREDRHCIAWATDDSYTGTSIEFGVPATMASIRTSYPYVCQPFRLSLEGDGVRLEATNPVGPGGPLAEHTDTLRYSRRHPILARAPLMAVDWSRPIFRRFTLHDVPLGPWPAVTASLAPGAKMSLSPLKVTHAGARKDFVVDQTPGDGWNSRRVMGDVLAAERLGWPWDALFGARHSEPFQQRSTVAAFDEAITTRFGPPTLVERRTGSPRRDHYWLFDLQGRQLASDEAGPGSCLETKPLWERRSPLSRIDVDVGPWNCLLVAHLRDDARGSGTVGHYELEVMNGYATALNHFAWRLEQIAALREQIQGTEARKVEL